MLATAPSMNTMTLLPPVWISTERLFSLDMARTSVASKLTFLSSSPNRPLIKRVYVQVKRAQELGAVGVLIYSDLRDDGSVTTANGYKA